MKLIGKLIKLIFRLITIVIVLAIVCTVCIGLVIYDDRDVTPNHLENDSLSLDEHINSIVSSAFDNIDTTEEINFSLSEENVEVIMKSFLNDLDNLPITGFDVVSMNDGRLVLDVGVEYSFFKTVATISLDAKIENDNLIISLFGIDLGKINDSIIKMVLNDKKIVSLVSKIGFTSYDDNKLSYCINLSDSKKLINDLFNDNPNKELFTLLFNKIYDDKDIIDISLFSNNKISLKLNLNKFKYDEDASIIKNKIPQDEVINKLNTLYLNSIINDDNNQVIIKYLIGGYMKLSSEEKEVINNTSFSSIGISPIDKITYDGYSETGIKSINEILLAKTNHISIIPSGGVDIQLNETDLNTLFNQANIVGTGISFNDVKNSKTTLIFVESLYTIIEDEQLYLRLIVNINGFRLEIKCVFESQTNNSFALEMKLDQLSIGEVLFNDSEKEVIIKSLNDSLSKQEWISFNDKTFVMKIDLTNSFNNLPLHSLINEMVEVNMEMIGNSGSEGFININLDLSLFE